LTTSARSLAAEPLGDPRHYVGRGDRSDRARKGRVEVQGDVARDPTAGLDAGRGRRGWLSGVQTLREASQTFAAMVGILALTVVLDLI
jgi:hypothetical protein